MKQHIIILLLLLLILSSSQVCSSESRPLQNNAIFFDGANNKLEIDYDPGSAPKNNFTIEVYVKPTGRIKIYEVGLGGLREQCYLIFPAHGRIWDRSDVGIGISIGRNGVSVWENGLESTVESRGGLAIQAGVQIWMFE